jgi:hypothetical protein
VPISDVHLRELYQSASWLLRSLPVTGKLHQQPAFENSGLPA